MEKYKKLREIGQGSFGRVALVQEKKGKGRKLVLKEVEVKRMAEGERTKVSQVVLADIKTGKITWTCKSLVTGSLVPHLLGIVLLVFIFSHFKVGWV